VLVREPFLVNLRNIVMSSRVTQDNDLATGSAYYAGFTPGGRAPASRVPDICRTSTSYVQ